MADCPPKILLVGYTTEKTFRHFLTYVTDLVPHLDVLDLAMLCDESGEVGVEETANDTTIWIGPRQWRLGEYDAVYNRAYWTDLGSPGWNTALSRAVRAIASWLMFCQGTVVNRPGAGMTNSNKFVHGLLLGSMGFAIPRTIATGEPTVARALMSSADEWVSKSCSSAKTRTVRANKALLERADLLTNCPSLFQNRIVGADVRVHCVDGIMLAERTESARIDSRFAEGRSEKVERIICDVPEKIATKCAQYCAERALLFAGFDFKVTPEGKWIALEANPMPGFESYDRRQCNRISIALLKLLLSGRQTPPLAGVAVEWPMAKGGAGRFSDVTAGLACPAHAENADAYLFVEKERRPVVTPFHFR